MPTAILERNIKNFNTGRKYLGEKFIRVAMDWESRTIKLGRF